MLLIFCNYEVLVIEIDGIGKLANRCSYANYRGGRCKTWKGELLIILNFEHFRSPVQ
jgi:hypothetical protein